MERLKWLPERGSSSCIHFFTASLWLHCQVGGVLRITGLGAGSWFRSLRPVGLAAQESAWQPAHPALLA